MFYFPLHEAFHDLASQVANVCQDLDDVNVPEAPLVSHP
jgi:hypothetical protein